jgi:hypothetical protein
MNDFLNPWEPNPKNAGCDRSTLSGKGQISATPQGIAARFLILAGINTHACIRATAIDAYQRGRNLHGHALAQTHDNVLIPQMDRYRATQKLNRDSGKISIGGVGSRTVCLAYKRKRGDCSPLSHVAKANGLPDFPVLPGGSDRDQFS